MEERAGHGVPATGGAAAQDAGPPVTGVDLARHALEEARAAARSRGLAVGRGKASPTGAGRTGRAGLRSNRRRWSGPGADDRDPQPLGRLTVGLVRSRGWSSDVAAGTVLGSWNTLVGKEIAEHAQPESLRDGVLVVRADSTAWATQLRLMQRQLVARIATTVGSGVVTRLTVQGPSAPSWKKGTRSVRGRGPRDTYG
ncbi:MAG: DUF721 family protein [Mycobacteriaceae bacterium]